MISSKNDKFGSNTLVVDESINIDGFDNDYNIVITLEDSNQDENNEDEIKEANKDTQ